MKKPGGGGGTQGWKLPGEKVLEPVERGAEYLSRLFQARFRNTSLLTKQRVLSQNIDSSTLMLFYWVYIIIMR